MVLLKRVISNKKTGVQQGTFGIWSTGEVSNKKSIWFERTKFDHGIVYTQEVMGIFQGIQPSNSKISPRKN